MESSTVLVFRIFVMLSCLIVVPMAAIFGSAFPDVVKTVLVDRIVAWSSGKTVETDKGTTESGFGQVTAPADAQGNANNWEAPRWGAQATTAPGGWQSPAATGQAGAVVPAGAAVNQGGGNQSASFAAPMDTGRGTAPAFQPPQSAGDAPNQSAGADRPMPIRQPLSFPGTGASGDARGMPAGQHPEQPERFTAMERRLREYGATYYLLETWGNEGELYRFHCNMAVANNPNYTRHFEATDRDALKAMAQVLEKVEAWRSGRQQ